MSELQELKDRVEMLEADIIVMKTVTPPPKGFKSWEQFKNIVEQANNKEAGGE